MSTAVDSFECAGLWVEIFVDQFPDCPRNWDNMGVMWSADRTSCIDQGSTNGLTLDMLAYYDELNDAKDWVDTCWDLRDMIAAHRHYGSVVIAFDADHYNGMQECEADDECATGYIYATEDMMRRSWGLGDKPITDELRRTFERILQGEIDMYRMWQNGEVYGVVVSDTDQDGEKVEVGALWGIYGIDEAADTGWELAKTAADELAEQRKADAEEVADLVAY